MAAALFWLVAGIMVAMATGAPLANQETPFTAPADSIREGDMRIAKRAEEMVYYGNQQNEPRLPMKKSDPSLQPSLPTPDEDEGSVMVAHDEVPVEEDLNSRAEVVKGAPEAERMEEGLKEAEKQVEKAMEKNEEEEEEEEDDDESEGESSEGGDGGIVSAASGENDDLPVADVAAAAAAAAAEPDSSAEADGEDSGNGSDDTQSAPLSSEDKEGDVDAGSSTDEDVEEFLQELGKESADGDDSNDNGEEESGNDKSLQMGTPSEEADPGYYQTMYHLLANNYPGVVSSGYGGENYDNYNYIIPYYRRRRRSPLHRRSLASIRRRRGHAGRFKRDLPSDWLALYRDLDLPVSADDVDDALLSEPATGYGYDQTNDDLSRYIYGNLLNKLVNTYGDSDSDLLDDSPYEDVLPYDIESEIPGPAAEEYEPEELMYDPEIPAVYREDPYEDYVPEYQLRKRSGGDYYPDSRRKRYFYPAFDEPETHWGAFVPEKRDYGDSIQRLQRLAAALGDNPRSYYENLLRGYRKK